MLKSSSQLNPNNSSFKSRSLRQTNLKTATDIVLTKSLVNKSISLTNMTSYTDLQLLMNKSRLLLVFFLVNCWSVENISANISTAKQNHLTKKYSLMSVIQANLNGNSPGYKPKKQLNTFLDNKNKGSKFILSNSNRKYSLSAWSYNSSKELYDNSKSYASFTFTDGFVPILTSATIHKREQTITLPNLKLRHSLFGNYVKISNLNSYNPLDNFLQKVKTTWINRLKLIKSKRYSGKNSRFLRTRRHRKLLRQRNNRVNSTQLLTNSMKHISYKVTSNKIKYTYTKSNLSRLVNSLITTFYSNKSYLVSSNQSSTNNSLLLSLSPKTLGGLHSYDRQSSILKTVFRSSNVASLSCNNIFPAINPANRVLRSFRPTLTKDLNFYADVTPWVNDNIIRLIENASGRRSLIQHSMHAENMVDLKSKLEYKKWITRMASYERNLGHRFFMEEALHIIHLSFRYHDVTLFSSWLKAIITRISFWKTRSIFRFLKYVFNNYYRFIFDSLSIKGIKIRLKGKISAAGNSRKRTILFRSGKNSYSSVNIKCIHDFKTITTFTGVMGFQVWLFY